MKPLQNGEIQLLQPGALFGPYRILRLLGEGSLGACYLCEHTQNQDNRFAVRVLSLKKLSSIDSTTRFMHQVYVSQHVDHKNILRIYDSVETKNLIACTMEYVEGGDLARWISQRPSIELRPSLKILVDICEGIRALHANGMAHHALLSKNVLMTGDGEPRLTHFGIPSNLERGQRSDICAIGALAYELITGIAPFPGQNVYELFEHLQRKMPETPHKVSQACPRPVSAIIMRALNPSTQAGYSSISELEEDFRSFLDITLPSEETFLKESRLLREIKISTGESIDTSRTPKDRATPKKQSPEQEPTAVLPGGVKGKLDKELLPETEVFTEGRISLARVGYAAVAGPILGIVLVAVISYLASSDGKTSANTTPIAASSQTIVALNQRTPDRIAADIAAPKEEQPAPSPHEALEIPTKIETVQIPAAESSIHDGVPAESVAAPEIPTNPASAETDGNQTAAAEVTAEEDLARAKLALTAEATRTAITEDPDADAAPPQQPAVSPQEESQPQIIKDDPIALANEQAPDVATETVEAENTVDTASLAATPIVTPSPIILSKPIVRIERISRAVPNAPKAHRATPSREQHEDSVVDSAKKTALLFYFSDYVRWPNLSSANAPLRICVLNDPATTRTLSEESPTIGARLRRTFSIASLRSLNVTSVVSTCNILYLGSNEISPFERANLYSQPVLTVSDGTGAGIINLTSRDGQLAIRLDGQRASSAGLSISLALLQLVGTRQH